MPGSTSQNAIGLLAFKGVIPPIPVFIKFASKSSRIADCDMNLSFLMNENKILQKLALLKVIICYIYITFTRVSSSCSRLIDIYQ